MKLHKFIIATIIALIVGTFVTTNVFAQATQNQTPSQFENALGDGKRSMEDYVADQGSFLINFGTVAALGCRAENCDKYKTGAMGVASTMVAGLIENPPASGIYYALDTIENFGIVTPAYAQTGTGFNALGPILPIWRAFRNFTYVLFVVLFAAMGLAIMFRMRLSPQAVITIQSALPRIISALILVTFSYAIAGLMIDLMYVFIGLVALMLGGTSPNVNAANLQEQFLRGGFFDLLGALLGQVGLTNFGNVVGSISFATAIPVFLGALFLGGGPIGSLVAGAAGGVIGGVLVTLILAIIVIYVLFRLFFQLLQSYISLVLLIIFAPLQIALGVIPGFPGFGAWFKSFMANLLVFPAVAAVLMIGMVISDNLNATGMWAPPFLTGGDLLTGSINGIIGFGILLIVHQVPGAVKNALGVRGLGLLPQESWRAGGAPFRGAAGAIDTQVGAWERSHAGEVARGGRAAANIFRFLGGGR